MEPQITRRLLAALLAAAAFNCLIAASQPPTDSGWPRVFTKNGRQLTVYQPQVDYWNGYTNVYFRCAIAVKGVTKRERFGIAEVYGLTLVDQAIRCVAMVPVQRNLRFPGTSDAEAAALRAAVDQIRPPDQVTTISLDQALACLKPGDQPQQPRAALNLDPPRIFYSRRPAILVLFLGEPQFQPVAPDQADLTFALNTNWDLFSDLLSWRYFLLDQGTWLTAPDVNGPWTPTQDLPASLSSLPANDNWAAVRENIPAKPPKLAPVVFVSTQPAEMIVTQGDPAFARIPGTRLSRVTNTESVLFQNSGDGQFYFLVAGRWFRAASLDGPWSAASRNLPTDFARIPDTDPAAFVKASVPGTRDAQDAVLLASVPATTTVFLTNPPVQVVYNGPPQFAAIPGTSVQYAVNSPYAVLMVDDQYYCCDQGVWFVGATAISPWGCCTNVPPAIYTIPPSSPLYNVTYATVQSFTPTSVVYSQTAGYSGEYVDPDGVVMFGAGMSLDAALAAQSEPYFYPAPVYYSYGCGAVYHYGYGGYYSAAYAAYGPYGGVGYATAYNPVTGTYARGAAAYGPYGTASVRQAYNPYTGAYAQAAKFNTAYGSAGRATAYNPTTGNAAWGGYRSSAYGSAGAVKTSQGAGVAAWSTPENQGAVAKTSAGDVYAGRDGNVYKRNPDGTWSRVTGSGWESLPDPRAQAQSEAIWRQQEAYSQARSFEQDQLASAASGWIQNWQSLESQAQARQWGNWQTQRAQSWQSRRAGWGRRW